MDGENRNGEVQFTERKRWLFFGLPLPRAFGEPIRGRTGRLLGEQKE